MITTSISTGKEQTPSSLLVILVILFSTIMMRASADVRINEIMSSNVNTIVDGDGDSSDWIELINTGTETVNLSGWGLSDDESSPFKWTFPTGINIEPGELLLVWASGKNRKFDYDPTWTDSLGVDVAGLWTFNENPGEQALDSSTNNNHGTVVGAQRANLGDAQVMSFNAAHSDSITIPNDAALQTTGSMTLSMWLKPADIERRQNPWEKAYGGEGTITQSAGTLTYYWGTAGSNTGPWQAFSSVEALSEDQWTHVTIVRDLENSYLKWYFNGRPVATGTPAYESATASTRPVRIGTGYAGAYEGQIGMVALLPRALDEEAVKDIYLKTRGAFPLKPRLHANFSISSDGEPILLSKPDTTQADAIPPIPLRRDISYGRQPNGAGGWLYFDSSTPETANIGQGFEELLEAPDFSHPPGFYDDPFDLLITRPVISHKPRFERAPSCRRKLTRMAPFLPLSLGEHFFFIPMVNPRISRSSV